MQLIRQSVILGEIFRLQFSQFFLFISSVDSYRETIKKLSSIFLDQNDKPLDRAVFWIEYVLRHKGAVHLRSAARNLSYIQYFSLDVIAVFVVIIIVDILILKALLKKCFGSKSRTVDKKKKQQ